MDLLQLWSLLYDGRNKKKKIRHWNNDKILKAKHGRNPDALTTTYPTTPIGFSYAMQGKRQSLVEDDDCCESSDDNSDDCSDQSESEDEGCEPCPKPSQREPCPRPSKMRVNIQCPKPKTSNKACPKPCKRESRKECPMECSSNLKKKKKSNKKAVTPLTLTKDLDRLADCFEIKRQERIDQGEEDRKECTKKKKCCKPKRSNAEDLYGQFLAELKFVKQLQKKRRSVS
ncbi:hypothetical protein WDU94_015051 [Cyamophila willieti]